MFHDVLTVVRVMPEHSLLLFHGVLTVFRGVRAQQLLLFHGSVDSFSFGVCSSTTGCFVCCNVLIVVRLARTHQLLSRGVLTAASFV